MRGGLGIWNKAFRTGVLVLMVLCGAACQQEDLSEAVGYLDFTVDTKVAVHPSSKAIIDGYNPKRLLVEVLDASNKVIIRTTDYDNWDQKGRKFPLKPGNYVIKAHSYGFDGKDSGFDIPFYAGEKQVTIKSGQLNIVEFTCTLQNVKVSVNFDENFRKSFKSAKAKILSGMSGILPVTFEMGATTASAYFPAGKLSAILSVVNKFDKAFADTCVFAKNAKPRSHYILNYKVSDSGSNHIQVETDAAQRKYTFTIQLPTESTTSLVMDQPVAWANFAIFKGQIIGEEPDHRLDPSLVQFEYKLREATEWTVVEALPKGNGYEAKVVGLTPNTEYEGRMVYKGDPAYESAVVSFTTEIALMLPNGGLDDWYKPEKTWYAVSEADFKGNRLFWDSSNPGTTTGAAAIVNVNPTTGVTSPTHSGKGKAARMQSQYAGKFGIGKFAAGSLYTGKFNSLVGTEGAKLDLGRKFTARPTQLTGWFRYSTGKIDYIESGLPAGAPGKGDMDVWSAYIALTTGGFTLDNTNLKGTAKDYKKLLQDDNDPFVVAYGELKDADCVTTSDWKKFTIDLVYKDLVRKPTHIIIVISSSKYGDYFTGSTSSLLYVDDLELVYGDMPKLKNEQ